MTNDDELVREMARVAYVEFHGAAIGCCEPSWAELPESFRQRMIDAQRAALARFREILEADGYRMVRVVKRERIPFTLDEDA